MVGAMLLTDFGLGEGEADDYARFMAWAIDPIFPSGHCHGHPRHNTGHGERERSRGSSAKGDLNEVLFFLKTGKKFSRDRQGRVQLVS